MKTGCAWERRQRPAGGRDALILDGTGQASHGDSVNAVRFAPTDGKTVASASDDSTVRLWEAASGKQLRQLTHTGTVNHVEYSPDARLVATSGSDNTVRVWTTTANARVVASLVHENRINAVTFSRDGRYAVYGQRGQYGTCLGGRPGTEAWRAVHDGTVLGIRFDDDGKYFVTASADRTARVWEIPGGTRSCARSKPAPTWRPSAVATRWRRSAATNPCGSWTSPNRSHRSRCAVRSTSSRYSPDGHYVAGVASKREGDEIQILETGPNRPVAPPISMKTAVQAMAFDRQSRHLAVASDDVVVLWDLANRRELPFKLEHRGEVWAIAFNASGSHVATGSVDGTAAVWAVDTGKQLAVLPHDNLEFVTVVEFSPDGTRLATGSDETLARVCGGKVSRCSGSVTATTWLPWHSIGAATRLASASDDNTARVWDIATGREVRRFNLASPGRAVKFAADDQKLNTVSLTGALGSWSLLAEAILIAEACSRLPRNLTNAEWKLHIGELPYEKTCPKLP